MEEKMEKEKWASNMKRQKRGYKKIENIRRENTERKKERKTTKTGHDRMDCPFVFFSFIWIDGSSLSGFVSGETNERNKMTVNRNSFVELNPF